MSSSSIFENQDYKVLYFEISKNYQYEENKKLLDK